VNYGLLALRVNRALDAPTRAFYPQPMQLALEARDLGRAFGERWAVDGLSFQVEVGEIVGLLGPNGAGKTTTLRMLTGTLLPTRGEALVMGSPVDREESRAQVGYLPEVPPLYPHMRVRRYLTFAAALRGVDAAARARAVDRVLERCQLTQVADRFCGRLSKGYRQRVGLAQALVHDPRVLVLDEPSSGLDPAQISEMRTLVRSLAGDHTVLLSTHILSEVEATCSRALVIREGRLLAQDSLDGLRNRTQGGGRLVVTVAREHPPLVTALEQVPGVQGVRAEARCYHLQVDAGDDCREAVARAVVESGCGLLELRSEGPDLEEIFLQLVGPEPRTGDPEDRR